MVALDKIKRLSQIQRFKDIPVPSRVAYPGAHCPLFGAALVLEGVSDAWMVVIGTEECTYYTKNFTLHRPGFGGLDGRCVSFVMDQDDITFGCAETLSSALTAFVKERNPPAVFLITTCLLEISGEDVERTTRRVTEATGVPILTVRTEHFICENHLPGMERAITACAALAEPPHGQTAGVNLLGGRLGSSEGFELRRALEESGIAVRMRLPSLECMVEDLRRAASARVNIVLDSTALPYARLMRERFGIPFVLFPRGVDPERIRAAYIDLFGYMGFDAPAFLSHRYESARAKADAARDILRGRRFIYGNTTIPVFSFTAFLTQLGMEPSLILTRDWSDADQPSRDEILRIGHDPYIMRSANLSSVRPLYDQLAPHVYIGHEDARGLKEQGIAQVTTDTCGGMIGYDLSEAVVDLMLEGVSRCA
ncbi:MAG: nitrogenase component 1 [Oscillospiraceae bacterium]|jgi:nitrogenase molybdenum-cofactor synthesis protein NifE|nr:nitrogenase component 1 [Oscillospiraceae bacterium]